VSAGADAQSLLRALEEELPAAVRLRRMLHAAPDPSGREGRTRDAVLAALPPGSLVTPVASTGAVVRVGGPGAPVAVRVELDAFPVAEETGLAWASRHPGVMHACGHDVHLAALVALVRTVSAVGGPAPLLAVLQPREETYPSGAQDVIASGVLRSEGCTAVVAAHVHPHLPAGAVSCEPGAVNASADEFAVTVRGAGGHAAYPHLTRDPILALAHVVVALQAIVSRFVDPLSSAVVTVGALRAGSAANAVPETAVARGTVRAMSAQERQDVHRRIGEVARGVAAAHGCEAEVALVRGEPVLWNDEALAGAAARRYAELGLAQDRPLRSMGADDFSFFADELPALMVFVGVGDQPGGLHSARFAPSDRAVHDVARAMLGAYLGACS
jgi:amidohydrolase